MYLEVDVTLPYCTTQSFSQYVLSAVVQICCSSSVEKIYHRCHNGSEKRKNENNKFKPVSAD